MKVFLLGATGRTGRSILDQLLLSDHHVTAYVRNPLSLPRKVQNLTVIEGSLSNVTKLKASMAGHVAVICALGHRSRTEKNPIISRTIRTVLQAMNEHIRLRRLIYIGAYGTSETEKDLGLLFRLVKKRIFRRNVFADHELAETMIRETHVETIFAHPASPNAGEPRIMKSGLEWVIVRAGVLTDGPLTGKYRAEERLGKGTPRISREDVAHFVVRQLAETKFLWKMVGLGY